MSSTEILLVNLNEEQKKELRALITYESNPCSRDNKCLDDNLTVFQRIRELLKKQEPLQEELLVWRGHLQQKYINPGIWFSTTTKESYAQGFTGDDECTDLQGNLIYDDGCLFKIHIQPGVKVVNVHNLYKEYGFGNPSKESAKVNELFQEKKWGLFNYEKEGEIIVEEGGEFYTDSTKTVKGFKKIEDDVFETYYYPPSESYVPTYYHNIDDIINKL